jgi:hypothetical protein
VDLDADGHLDLISGSYDPGALYLFRGLGKGELAAREVINGSDGKPVLTKPDQQQDVESFGSWVAAIDWDEDGDLDLLIGSFEGGLLVRLNEGTKTEPSFATTNITLMVGDQPAQIPGSHATPSIADWDGDGRWDILSGSEDGGVYWLRNVGIPGAPRFDAVENIVPPHVGNGYEESVADGDDPAPGIRSQVFATDFNLDGKVDLLVGDFRTVIRLRSDLTDEDRTALEAAQAERKAAGNALGELVDQLRKSFNEKYPGDQGLSDEATRIWTEMYLELTKSDAYAQAINRRLEAKKALNRFLVPPANPSSPDDYAQAHGFVWLYLRK